MYSKKLQQLDQHYNEIEESQLKNYEIELKIRNRVFTMLPDKKKTDTIPTIFGKTYDEKFINDYLAYILDPTINGIGLSSLLKLLKVKKMNC